LENGAWSAGETTLLVADIEEPYQVILGNPFLRRHRIAIVPGEEPQLLKSQDGNLEPIDLFEAPYGPPTLVERMDGLGETERSALAAELAQACAVRLHEQVSGDQKELEDMATRAKALLSEFNDLFPLTLPPLTADYLVKCT
ncbi:hypothetical protein JCM3770_002545, partial [Rhodotorula araucariae]